jgi:hypothetical protein
MRKFLSLTLPTCIAVASCPLSLLAGWGTRPTVEITVGNGASHHHVTVGTALQIVSKAVDSDNDLVEHWLEIQNPNGTWSWQGWLRSEPWAGALVGSTSQSRKEASFTFDQPGNYVIRATANDFNVRDSWVMSQPIHVTVSANGNPPAGGGNGENRENVNNGNGGNNGNSSGGNVTPPPVEPPPVAPPPVAPPPVANVPSSIFNSDGTVNRTAYVDQLAVWTRDAVNRSLGPTFEQLNPGAPDDRPTHFKPDSKACATSYVNKINPYELGPASGCSPDNDYWSEAGQVAYVPDDMANDPGLDRVQTFAYYDHVFALSPRHDWTGIPHPDPQTQEVNYKQMLGFTPRYPVAMVRNYGMLQNEALVLYRDGLLGVAGTQTSREWWERPYPGILFPGHKVPTSIAVTTGNEFALVTVWDTQTLRGQLAVVALEAKWLPFHTWPYMALPNQGSWSDMKLLGYIDLPMAAPTSVAAASNGWWDGPSQTSGLVLSQIDLANDGVRAGILGGDSQWSMMVANKGYAIVASKFDNKAVIVDLSPLFEYVRQSYLSSGSSFWNTLANRGSGAGKWPLTFSEKSDIMPRVVWEQTLQTPTAVLAGLRLDRWSPDRHKAYVAQEDGTINIIDTSSLMARWPWEKVGALTGIGTFKVGRNPVSMAFARHLEFPLPLLPQQPSGPARPDPLNNIFYVACRGDREVVGVVTFNGQGTVYRRIKDSRMGDPVAVSVAGRGNIVTVADFSGKKILSFRVGAIWDRHGRVYGAGADGKADFEFTGELPLAGHPIAVNTVNVN